MADSVKLKLTTGYPYVTLPSGEVFAQVDVGLPLVGDVYLSKDNISAFATLNVEAKVLRELTLLSPNAYRRVVKDLTQSAPLNASGDMMFGKDDIITCRYHMYFPPIEFNGLESIHQRYYFSVRFQRTRAGQMTNFKAFEVLTRASESRIDILPRSD